MKDFILSLFERYKQKGILIDTNILLLWFVGSVNRERIQKFNRTEKFVPEDYDRLQQILGYFYPKVVTTPNILTEVNSLAGKLGEPERSQCFSIFGKYVANLNEFYIESKVAVNINNFTKFGLTDSGILAIAKNQYLVLTDDFRLANYLSNSGVDVVNFNHLREYLLHL